MPQRRPPQGLLHLPYVGHPSTLETFIPVWGSGREAIADFQDGDYLGAAGNAALAASDLMLAGGAVKGVAKVAIHANKMAKNGRKASYKWDAARDRMVNNGYLKKGEPGHHAFIERNGPIGKRVPDIIKNQEWNITPLPDAKTHGRIHHKWKTDPRFDPITRTIVGSPPWAKAAAAGAAGDGAAAAKAQQDKRKRR